MNNELVGLIEDESLSITVQITESGPQGISGNDGYTPVKGIDYFDGKDGTDGINGKDGYTPIKGIDYFDGKDGEVSLAQLNVVKNEVTSFKEEYTNQRQQDQLKVAKVEKGLNDYKSTMANVNVNQEAKQKVTGYGTISLPKNTANGQVGASLKGNTVTDENGTKSTISASRLKSVDKDGIQESISYLPNVGELRSLPNGTKDEIRVSGGKAEKVQRVSDDYIFQSANFIGMNTTQSDVDIAITNNNFKTDMKLPVSDSVLENSVRISDRGQIPLIQRNDIANIGKFYVAITGQIGIIFAKGTSITQAREQITNQTLTYQLAEPIITPIEVSGTLLSNPSGTVYVENVVADAGIYTDKFIILQQDLPIKEIEKISKVDFNTGVKTQLDVTKAVINADKKSFTHPSLTANDIVFTTYFYDVESTQGELTVEYYDSRHTLKDSVTGKFYKIVPTVANGVLSQTLVEV